jgi:hypothetical protein
MSDIPPELRPDTEEEYQKRRQRMWIGIGVPSLIGALLAVALGVPWWIVAIFIALEAITIFFTT